MTQHDIGGGARRARDNPHDNRRVDPLQAVWRHTVNPASPDWLHALRAYFCVSVLGNLAWESLHLPLYTIWTTGTANEQLFAVVHCTGGDILIALASLALALMLVGGHGFWPVAMLAIGFGVAYAGFSEWLNVYVRRSWAYSEWMPVVTIGGYRIGLSPILQWILVPAVSLWVAARGSTEH